MRQLKTCRRALGHLGFPKCFEREYLLEFLQMCEIYNPLQALGIMSLTPYQNTLHTLTPFSQQSNLITLNSLDRFHTFLSRLRSFSSCSFADTEEVVGKKRPCRFLSHCCQTSAELRLEAVFKKKKNVCRATANLPTSAMHKTDVMHTNSGKLCQKLCSVRTFSMFKRTYWLQEQINGKNNVFSRFSCGWLGVADVLCPSFFVFPFGCLSLFLCL